MADLDFLHELIQSAADGAYIVDQDQRIIAWNQAAEDLLGFRAQAVVGLPCYQILSGQGDAGCVVCRRNCQPFSAGRRGERVPSFDVSVRTTSGHPRWVNASVIAFAVEDEADPTSFAVVHFVRDAESRKQAEAFATEVAAWARQLNLRPVVPELQDEEMALSTPLSRREFQVLELLAQGMDTEAIAAKLVIGKATVRNHVQRILHKLGVHSRLEAVTYAREHHLID
jgi:PAS domain S-box-containing protein